MQYERCPYMPGKSVHRDRRSRKTTVSHYSFDGESDLFSSQFFLLNFILFAWAEGMEGWRNEWERDA